MKTRDFLLLEAFKLFTSKPYDHVTFTELEKATGLSRGAILYHFKSKELLFNAVVEHFVLETPSVSDLLNEKCDTLLEFIKKFISGCKDEMREYRSYGIYNLNLAKFHIEFHALSFYKDMQEIARKWIDKEHEVWLSRISKAKDNKEIKDYLNSNAVSMMFINLYLGTSFSGVYRPKGYDIALLEKEFMTLYNLIKND